MTIITDIPQQSDAWNALRCGRITASRAGDVMTLPRSKADQEAGKLSDTAKGYMLQLLLERFTNRRVNVARTTPMQWGCDWEDTAREVYEELTGRTVQQVSFMLHDEIMAGCSPDGLVGDMGGLEIKCPYTSQVHMSTVCEGTIKREYRAQIQFSLWISGREWWDFMSYDPRIEEPKLAAWIIRVERDEEYIGRLERRCRLLLDEVDRRYAELAKLKERRSHTHKVAHLCVEPITLKWKGEVITI